MEKGNWKMTETKLKQWHQNAAKRFSGLDAGPLSTPYIAFEAVLTYIWRNKKPGACHDSSAVLFILLSELNLSPQLFIGEVMAHRPFDHSWVEIDKKVIDPAVSYPQPKSKGGEHVGGPVFLGIDLDTCDVSKLIYGNPSLHGLDSPADFIETLNLDEYSQYIEDEDGSESVWAMAKRIGNTIGLELNEAVLRSKYGTDRRQSMVR